MTKPRLILHIGYPRTGTTYFQKTLDANRDRMLETGFYLPPTTGFRHRELQLFGRDTMPNKIANLVGADQADSPIEVATSWVRRAGETTPDGCTVIMSEETVATASAAGLQQLRAAVADAFSSVEIYVCFRPHASLAASDHAQRVRVTFFPMEFSRFAEDMVDKPHFDYCAVADQLVSHFGHDHVNAFVYSGKADVSSNDMMAEHMGIKNSLVNESNRTNESLPATVVEIKRRLNPSLKELAGLVDRVDAGFHNRMNRFISTWDLHDNPEGVGSIADISETIQDKWNEDWRELTEGRHADLFKG